MIEAMRGWTTNLQQSFIEELNSDIKAIIERVADKILGRHQHRRKATVLLRDQNLRKARTHRRRCWRNWKRDGLEESLEEYRKARKEQRKATKEAIRKGFDDFTEAIEQMEDTEVSKVIATMVRRRTRGQSNHLGSDEASLSEYAEHFEKQFSRQEFHPLEMSERTKVNIEVEGVEEEVPFSAKDVHTAMRMLPKAKAPGTSGLRNELVREAPYEMAIALWGLFKACWMTGLIPKEWNMAIIHPVPKKGDLSIIANYRPISLTETLRKLYEKCLQPALTRILEPILDISQGGFREKRSTVDQVASLHEAIIQRRKVLGRKPLVAYLDIKAAYDTVYRPILWQRMKEKGIGGNLLRILQALFDNVRSRVAIQGNTSRTLNHQVGLLQGSTLSPILYATFINELPERLRTLSTCNLGDTRLASFLYADDIAIIADSTEQMERYLKECEAFAQESCFKFQATKCEIVAEKEVNTENCTLHGQTLRRSASFVYLGITLDTNGINEIAHATRLCSKTVDSINMMRSVGYNGGGFSTKVKKRLYETFIRPKLEYGLQIIQPRGAVLKMIEQTQHYALCAMFSVGRTTSNARLCGMTGIQSMKQRCNELNGAWAIRTGIIKGGGFMVRQARKAAERKPIRKSVFQTEKGNGLVVKFRDEHIWGKGARTSISQSISISTSINPSPSTSTSVSDSLISNTIDRTSTRTNTSASDKESWRDTYRKVREEGRRAERERLWKEKGGELGLISKRPLDTAKMIDTHQSRLIRRRLTLWVLRRHIGRPITCMNCLGSRSTYDHVQECIGARVDQSIDTGQWLLAARQISDIEEHCLGRRTRKLRRELEEEDEKMTRREEDREQSRKGFTAQRGQWASWRYYARGDPG